MGFVPRVDVHGALNRCSAATTSSSMETDDEIDRRLEQARALWQKSKAKLESKDSRKEESLPFFASAQTRFVASSVRDGIIKSKNEETGLVTADGEKMAAVSEQEEWEVRSLLEVFDNEIGENEDVYSLASQQLAERDVAASVWNLRKTMQTEDYRRIFDTKNIFIGEDN